MTNTTKTIKKEGYAGLIWISCIDAPRNKLQITREWGLSVDARPLHRVGVKKSVDELIRLKLLEEKPTGYYYSRFEAFPVLVDSYFQQQFEVNKKILKSPEFIEFLNRDWVRKDILSLKNTKDFFGGSVYGVRVAAISPIVAIISMRNIFWTMQDYAKMEKVNPKVFFNYTIYFLKELERMVEIKVSAFFIVCLAAFLSHKKDVGELDALISKHLPPSQ